MFLEIAYDDGLEHWLTTSRGKTHERSLVPQAGSEMRVFAIFSRLHHFFFFFFFFFDIAQDCSLGQCLTSSRAETSKKKFCGPNWGLHNLFYSSVATPCLFYKQHFCKQRESEIGKKSSTN